MIGNKNGIKVNYNSNKSGSGTYTKTAWKMMSAEIAKLHLFLLVN